MASQNITANYPDGDLIGLNSASKIGFYGATPVALQTGAGQTAVSTASITAAATTAAVSALEARLQLTITLANQLRSDLVDLGLIKGSA